MPMSATSPIFSELIDSSGNCSAAMIFSFNGCCRQSPPFVQNPTKQLNESGTAITSFDCWLDRGLPSQRPQRVSGNTELWA